MNCQSVREKLVPGFLDADLVADRRSLLSHLRECRACREAAAAVDPTVVFCLEPEPSLEREEVEEIRSTVQALRRIRALESTWSRYGRRSLVWGSVAALLVLGLVLIPGPVERTEDPSTPFAEALGVGTGVITIPSSPVEDAVELRLELERGAAARSGAVVPVVEPIGDAILTIPVGSTVDHRVGSGFRVRFRVEPGSSVEELLLADFRLSQQRDSQEELLLRAELRPRVGRPMVVGVPSPEADASQIWLRLSWPATGL